MIQLTITIENGKGVNVQCPGVADPLRLLGILALGTDTVISSMKGPPVPDQKVAPATPLESLRILRPNGN